MASDWDDYQEEAADLFRSMGLEAETNVMVRGVRTTHDVDVVVKSKHAGFEITWLVECKHWKTPVSKLHALALREIVADTGAERGIMLCEVGFQSGAIEAANLTNVQVTSLENVRTTSGSHISAMRLQELFDRVEDCHARYWEMPKEVRIRHGLRADYFEHNYSGDRIVTICRELLSRALRRAYPFKAESYAAMIAFAEERQFNSPEEVIAVGRPMIEELEAKLNAADG